jgi:limonene-1,2-epoxide hydrolase
MIMSAVDTNTTTDPAEVTRDFLEALAAGNLGTALDLVDADIEYVNVPFPVLRGRDRLEKAFRPLQRDRLGFRVHFHNVSRSDGVVLTERTDALLVGPLHWQFWVYGRFEVVDGRITVWRDSFDFADVLVGLARGLLGIRWPGLNRRWPG